MSVEGLVSLVTTNSTLLVPLLQAEDPETCRLLGPFALVVQAIMAALVLGSLAIKRAREKPRRKVKVWVGDVAKQIIGQMFLHGSNVLVASAISAHKGDNPCAGYAINIIVDTTFGVFVMWACLRLSTILVHHFDPSYRTGFYGKPFSLAMWARQCGVYVGCMAAMKAVVIATFWLIPDMFTFANWALSWIQSDEAQLIIVMLIVPTVMNIIQFLILDSILRFASPDAVSEADSTERALLFEDDEHADYSDDEENGLGRRSRRQSEEADSSLDAQKVDDGKLGAQVRTSVVGASPISAGIASSSTGSGASSVAVNGFAYPPPSITITAPGARSRRSSGSSVHAAAEAPQPTVTRAPSPPPPAPTPPPPAAPPSALAHAAPDAAEDESFDDDWGFDDPEPDEEELVSEKVAGGAGEGGAPPVAQFSY